MKRVFFCFLLLSVFTCQDVNVNIHKEFIKTDIPKLYTDDWFQLNHSTHNFSVSIEDQSLKITQNTGREAAELKLENGTLKGITHGASGKLIFVPSQDSTKQIEIKSGNIKFIFKFKERIYFIEALAHLSYTGGAIYELIQDGDHFTFNKRLEFKDTPEAFTCFKNTFLIATHKHFYVVEDFKQKLIFRNAFWSDLYPNSLAVIDYDHVYMGIRSGFVKLNLIDKKLTFYKYTEN
ncbi:hypothetical protein FNB79_14310 [Formosa sediminum]|uniref:Uncharacterized protein n=1 Tax=Formosa sediminum TaxID=2594004 RepID=A0A516GU90_9FLAO|nr:hypothetical protein [Formosa sediminum]QDO95094.1 hypothetical protein FNB79_14310 [Formosa sediminum]